MKKTMFLTITLFVALTGEFDGKAKVEERTVKVGNTWTQVQMDYLPPQCIAGRLSAAVLGSSQRLTRAPASSSRSSALYSVP